MTRAVILMLSTVGAALAMGGTALAGGPTPTGPPRIGPVLAGPDVLWAVSRQQGGFDVRRAAASGGPSAQLARFEQPGPENRLEPALAASPQRTVVGYASGDATSSWLRRTVLSAPPGGTFETLDRDCNLFATPDRPRSIDASGAVVGYGRCTSDGRQEVVVRDYSAPVPVEQVIPGAYPLGLRVAGRYVAWLEGGSGQVYVASGIAVYDRLAGSLAYRIPKSAMPGDVHDLDLQDDGTIAFSYAARGGMRIAWASPAHTSPRTLPLPARESYEVRIAGGRVGFEAGRSAGAGEITLANVGVTDLTGHARRLGNLGEGSLFSDDFDFDGSRLTWWTYGCTRAFVHVVPAAGPAAISPARTGCPLRFSGPATVSRGMVRVQVDCFGFAGGVCTAQDVTLVVRRAHRRVVVGRGHSAGRVKLTPAGRALLRRRRLLRVSASATLSDDAGRRERRAGRIALAGSGGQR